MTLNNKKISLISYNSQVEKIHYVALGGASFYSERVVAELRQESEEIKNREGVAAGGATTHLNKLC